MVKQDVAGGAGPRAAATGIFWIARQPADTREDMKFLRDVGEQGGP